jgi:hypothetical protein
MTGEARATEFASQFGPCEAHRREAPAVHAALEQLAKRSLSNLDPEATIADLLFAAGVLATDAGGAQERHVSVARVLSAHSILTQALKNRLPDRIRSTLLGPAASSSTWLGHTLGARSVRGIVNERVRCLGGCRCAE